MKTKVTNVCGVSVTLHSLDGSFWCMKEEDVWVALKRQKVQRDEMVTMGKQVNGYLNHHFDYVDLAIVDGGYEVLNESSVPYRETGLLEDICQHSVGHPNEEFLSKEDRFSANHWKIHGCDGCCGEREGEGE